MTVEGDQHNEDGEPAAPAKQVVMLEASDPVANLLQRGLTTIERTVEANVEMQRASIDLQNQVVGVARLTVYAGAGLALLTVGSYVALRFYDIEARELLSLAEKGLTVVVAMFAGQGLFTLIKGGKA